MTRARHECKYCQKQLTAQGLKAHTTWCKQNPQSRSVSSQYDSSEEACVVDDAPKKGRMQTINLLQTFNTSDDQQRDRKNPDCDRMTKRKLRCFFCFTKSDLSDYCCNGLLWLVFVVFVVGLLPYVVPLMWTLIGYVQNVIAWCEAVNRTIYRASQQVMEFEEIVNENIDLISQYVQVEPANTQPQDKKVQITKRKAQFKPKERPLGEVTSVQSSEQIQITLPKGQTIACAKEPVLYLKQAPDGCDLMQADIVASDDLETHAKNPDVLRAVLMSRCQLERCSQCNGMAVDIKHGVRQVCGSCLGLVNVCHFHTVGDYLNTDVWAKIGKALTDDK